jgi:hypothetical protein
MVDPPAVLEMVRAYWTGEGAQPTIPAIKATAIKKLLILLTYMTLKVLLYH